MLSAKMTEREREAARAVIATAYGASYAGPEPTNPTKVEQLYLAARLALVLAAALGTLAGSPIPRLALDFALPGECFYKEGSRTWERRPALSVNGWEACEPEPYEWNCTDNDPRQGEPGCAK